MLCSWFHCRMPIGQQILAVMQNQLIDVDQVLLIEGAQNGPIYFYKGFWACKVESSIHTPVLHR